MARISLDYAWQSVTCFLNSVIVLQNKHSAEGRNTNGWAWTVVATVLYAEVRQDRGGLTGELHILAARRTGGQNEVDIRL